MKYSDFDFDRSDMDFESGGHAGRRRSVRNAKDWGDEGIRPRRKRRKVRRARPGR